MLESKRVCWIVLSMVTMPLTLSALMPEEVWCYGSACKPPEAGNFETHVIGGSPDLVFSFHLEFEVADFPPGSGLKLLEVTENDEMVLKLNTVPNFTGGADLILSYQVSPTMTGSLYIGPAPIPNGEVQLEISRTKVGQNRGEISVTRGGLGTYSTGTVLMSGQPQLIEQGPLEVIGAPEGRIRMSQAEIE